MSFKKLNEEEEIKIDIIESADQVNLILRNLNNENIKHTFDKSSIKNIKELRLDVRSYFNLIDNESIEHE
jgi:hypothetical protein